MRTTAFVAGRVRTIKRLKSANRVRQSILKADQSLKKVEPEKMRAQKKRRDGETGVIHLANVTVERRVNLRSHSLSLPANKLTYTSLCALRSVSPLSLFFFSFRTYSPFDEAS